MTIKSFILTGISCLLTSPVFADEKVLITTDEQAKEILMGHDWECKWKDPYFSGTTKTIILEASLNYVIAKGQASVCPDGWGKFKGKFKKGKLNGKNYDYPGPCQGSNKQTSTYYKSSDGTYFSKGKYIPSTYDARGEYHCIAVPKGSFEEK